MEYVEIINDWFCIIPSGCQQTTQIGPKNTSKKGIGPRTLTLPFFIQMIYLTALINRSSIYLVMITICYMLTKISNRLNLQLLQKFWGFIIG